MHVPGVCQTRFYRIWWQVCAKPYITVTGVRLYQVCAQLYITAFGKGVVSKSKFIDFLLLYNPSPHNSYSYGVKQRITRYRQLYGRSADLFKYIKLHIT